MALCETAEGLPNQQLLSNQASTVEIPALTENLGKLNRYWVHTILRLGSDGVKILMCALGAF